MPKGEVVRAEDQVWGAQGEVLRLVKRVCHAKELTLSGRVVCLCGVGEPRSYHADPPPSCAAQRVRGAVWLIRAVAELLEQQIAHPHACTSR